MYFFFFRAFVVIHNYGGERGGGGVFPGNAVFRDYVCFHLRNEFYFFFFEVH